MSDTPAYDSLSFKQRRFVDVYMETWNKTRAAEEAGLKHPGQLGYRWFKKVQIQAAIAEQMKAHAMRADEVLKRLSEQARANVAEFITVRERITVEPVDPDEPDGELIRVRNQEFEINYDALKKRGHLVKKIFINRQGTGIELYDAQAALVQIGKAEQIFHENELNVDVQESRVNIYVPDNGRNPSTT